MTTSSRNRPVIERYDRGTYGLCLDEQLVAELVKRGATWVVRDTLARGIRPQTFPTYAEAKQYALEHAEEYRLSESDAAARRFLLW